MRNLKTLKEESKKTVQELQDSYFDKFEHEREILIC
jgi:hypothetical protein